MDGWVLLAVNVISVVKMQSYSEKSHLKRTHTHTHARTRTHTHRAIILLIDI
jgi:hypothetical protein